MNLALIGVAALAAWLAPGDPVRGDRAYGKCYGCHSLEPDKHANGPSLHNIVGKPIAAVADYPYSEALKALAARERVWTPELLERFIADPEAVAPGTDMGFFLKTDPQERADLVAYLRSFSVTPAEAGASSK